MADEHGFAQVWSDAHRERSVYLMSLVSGFWSTLKKNRTPVALTAESRSEAFPTLRITVAKAA